MSAFQNFTAFTARARGGFARRTATHVRHYTSAFAIAQKSASMWGVRVNPTRIHRGHEAIVFETLGSPFRVIKVGIKNRDMRAEAAALTEWNGRGAARLFRFDEERRVLLLEGLRASCTLNRVSADEAARIVGALGRELAINPMGDYRSTAMHAAELLNRINARNKFSRQPWSDLVLNQLADITRPLLVTERTTLVHGDLNPGNVLSRPGGGWAAVDPQPLIGDIESSLVPVIFRHRDARLEGLGQFDALIAAACDAAQVDIERTSRWVALSAASAALFWEVEARRDGPAHSARLAATMALAGMA